MVPGANTLTISQFTPGWTLTGNAGTNPATNSSGTTDYQAFEIRVNSSRALRVEPFANAAVRTVNMVGGWSGNSAAQNVYGATIAGGGGEDYSGGSWLQRPNTVSGSYGVVAGGYSNSAADYSAVSGGNGNSAGSYGAVGGGGSNSANGWGSTVAGGYSNSAATAYSNVGGGWKNSASGNISTVAGGTSNSAGGSDSAVGGGDTNSAGGSGSTVAGGMFNSAGGDCSFAAGRRAKADHNGAFVWSDNANDADMGSPAANTFSVRASGGIWLGTTSSPSIASGHFIDTSTGAYLTTGGAWTNSSDRALKAGFKPADGRTILDRLARMPINTWRYKAEGAKTSHIGPTAQDFASAFGYGGDDKSIGTIDADGVALAAIKGLYEMVQKQEATIKQLQAEVESLKKEEMGGV